MTEKRLEKKRRKGKTKEKTEEAQLCLKLLSIEGTMNLRNTFDENIMCFQKKKEKKEN